MSQRKKKTVRFGESWEMKMIEAQTMRFRGKFDTRDEDLEDIQQELSAYVAKRMREEGYYRMATEKKTEVFPRWLNHKVWKLKESLKTDRYRLERKMVPLTQEIGPRGDMEGLIEIAEDPRFQPEPRIEALELEVKVRKVLRKLTPTERAVCRGIMAGNRKRSIAQKAGIHRSTVYEIVSRLRDLFSDEDLKDYA